MRTVILGPNAKLTVLPSEREAIRKFYRDVLDCPQTRESDRADIFQIGPDFFIAAVYDKGALSLEDRMKSIWLELRTPDVEALKARILAFGIKPIDYWEKDHFYFQAPGGQVYRLADDKEDLSRFQK